MSPALPDSLRGLLSPGAYAHPVGAVELVQTHISWVLLAGEFAYKLKRPVRYAFIDLREPARRKLLCEEELRLNRRFAPQLYLEVCAVVRDDCGAARIAAHPMQGPVLEYAVRMRRFAAQEQLDRLLADHRIEPRELEDFGRELATVHSRLPAAAPESPWGRTQDLQALILRNHLECATAAAALDAAEPVRALRPALEGSLTAAATVMEARRSSGHVRECHGDLHARNIVRCGERLVAFDCLEYEPAFRWIDVADEVAFLASDLAVREHPQHAHAFLGGYLAQSGDYGACRVLRLYETHRALVRAKVTALEAAAAADEQSRTALRAQHDRLIAHAAASLARRKPVMVLMHGLSGSGKTWLATRLAQRLLAVHVRSDVERKRLAGLEALARTQAGVARGIYAQRMSAAVYEHLAGAAEHIVAGGCSVIIDAAFLHRAQRERFAGLGARLGLRPHLVHCAAPVATLRARVAERARSGLDASDADRAVLQWQLEHYEPVLPDEPLRVTRVETAAAGALEAVMQDLL